MLKRSIICLIFIVGFVCGQVAHSELFSMFDYYSGTWGEPLSANDYMPSGRNNLRILIRNRIAPVTHYWDDIIESTQLKANDEYDADYFRIVHQTAVDYGITEWLDFGFRLPLLIQSREYADIDRSNKTEFGDVLLRVRAEPLSGLDYFWRSSVSVGLKAPTGNAESNFINTGNGTFDLAFFWYNMLDFDGSRILFDVGYILTGQRNIDSASVRINEHNGDVTVFDVACDFDILRGVTGGVVFSGCYKDRTKFYYRVGGPNYRNDDSFSMVISPYATAHIPNTPITLSLGSFHTVLARNMPALNGIQIGLQVDGAIWF